MKGLQIWGQLPCPSRMISARKTSPHLYSHIWVEVSPSWLCWFVTECDTQKPGPSCRCGLATGETGLPLTTVKPERKTQRKKLPGMISYQNEPKENGKTWMGQFQKILGSAFQESIYSLGFHLLPLNSRLRSPSFSWRFSLFSHLVCFYFWDPQIRILKELIFYFILFLKITSFRASLYCFFCFPLKKF